MSTPAAISMNLWFLEVSMDEDDIQVLVPNRIESRNEFPYRILMSANLDSSIQRMKWFPW